MTGVAGAGVASAAESGWFVAGEGASASALALNPRVSRGHVQRRGKAAVDGGIARP